MDPAHTFVVELTRLAGGLDGGGGVNERMEDDDYIYS